MVPAANLNGVLDEPFVLIDRQVGDELCTDLRVPLDNLVLLRREGMGLGQDLLRNLQLADVVQARGHADGLDILAL